MDDEGTMKTTPAIILQAMRPRQWIKNVALLVPLVFSRNLLTPAVLVTALAATATFCLLSGGVYLLNDLIDIEQDRRHPLKSRRPLAAGTLSVGLTRWICLVSLLLALGLGFLIHTALGLAALAYLGVQVAYSLALKHVVILDTFCIAAGFFIRVVAGAYAIEVEVSSWLLVCTIFVSLFMALGKRRHEILLLEDQAAEHRTVLKNYDVLLLDQMISVVTAATLVAYSVYTLAPETVQRFGTDDLKYTIPFVLYGIYRYLYLVYRKQQGGAPETLLLTDLPMLINMGGYAVVLGWILYGR
jgi:4-hydroxybenzoate polyprenyltransferase